MRARLGATFSFVLLVSLAGSAAAQPADATVAAERFAAGEDAYNRGDYVRAAEAFDAAFAADPQPAALWNAARSWHRAGERARAANLYQRYVGEAPSDAPDRDEATRAMIELGRDLGRVEIVAPGADAVLLDGRPVHGGVVFANPGTHALEATFGGARARREITIEAGSTKTALVEPPPREKTPPLPAPIPPQPPGPAAEAHGGVTPWVMAPFVGATVLAGALTIASGVDTLVARGQYLDIPEDERTVAQYDDGKFKQDRTNVMIGVTAGLAVVTTAVAVFAIDWGKGTLIGVTPGGLRAHGWF